jgi:DNA-binding NarL/FixJ family response regulator
MNTNRLTRIAVVEDSATVRESLVKLLSAMPGYRCVCACASAEAAVAELPKHMPDVVLMDIHLPGESGIACTARLTELLPHLQVIMLTVYKDTNLIFDALKAGACGYVLKRANPEEVLQAVNDVRSGGAPMTPEIARMVVRSFRGGGGEMAESCGLSVRQLEVLSLLSAGRTNKEISAVIGLSEGTVRTHLMQIFKKLHVHSRSEAIAKYLRHQSVRFD